MKQISNLSWIKLVLKNHQPRVYAVGSQRDPETIVRCQCQSPLGIAKHKTAEYSDHILEIIQGELPGIFNEKEDKI